MRIAINLGPDSRWPAILEAVQRAETAGFDAVSFLDHYQSEKPEYGYLCGWSLYGALAMATSRIKLVPMVIDRLNYFPGVLAKETSTLSLLSKGRFELGIGAGDYFEEAAAWGIAVPNATARINGLKETILALQKLWTGKPVTFSGEHLHLTGAIVAPAPATPIRVVVGVGKSRRLIRSAVEYADEINTYADEKMIRFARQQIDASGRDITLSVYGPWEGLEKREDLVAAVASWEQLGADRAFLTFWYPFSFGHAMDLVS